jgi:hypothetical protein
MASECQVLEHTIFLIVESSTLGLHRVEAIDVDANMVVVDILELTVLYGVNLNGKYIVIGIAIALVIEEA